MKYRFIFMLTCLVVLAGCASTGSVSSAPQTGPKSKQVMFVESSGDGRVLYEVWGIGEDFSSARQDAEKAALWAALYMGNQALLDNSTAKKKFEPVAKHYYAQVEEYVRYLSTPLGKQVDTQDRVHLKYRVAIDVQQLREQLQSEGVLSNTAVVNAQIGLPSVVVLPTDSNAKVAANIIEQYLVSNGFSLVDKNASEKGARLIEKVARLNGQTDPMFVFASKLGADVYVETGARVHKIKKAGFVGHQANVQARAYETATGQLLGSATGYSAKRVNTAPEALVQEAANDAASELVARLIKAWKRQAAQGVWFKVVVALLPEGAEEQEMQLYKAMRQLKPTQLKRLKVGAHSVSYLIRLKNVSDATSLYYTLKKHYLGSGQLRRELGVGRLLILRLDSGEGEMLLD